MAKKETARPLHESYQPFVKSLEEYTNAASIAGVCGQHDLEHGVVAGSGGEDSARETGCV